MSRKPRIDLAGYHHLVNRGVNRVTLGSGVENTLLLCYNLPYKVEKWQENYV